MTINILIALFGIVSFFTFLKAFFECKNKKNAFGTPYKVCELYGSFVWADHVVFGFFWTVVSIIVLILQDWILFLLTVSLFWLVRSIGETIYWFLQQFAPRKGNEPKKFWSYPIFHNDSIWFVNQIAWQCTTVITLITSIYLSVLWVRSF